MKCAHMLAASLLLALSGLASAQGILPSGSAPAAAPLPANHPPLDQLMAQVTGTGDATTQPSAIATTGSLSIAVIPGTAGGGIPANGPVTVELYHRSALLKKLDLKLDGEGKLTIPNLPIMPPVQAMITLNHGGLVQQAISPELSPTSPNASIQVKVFETTEEAPAWTVAMQHMIVQWATDGSGIKVTEMISATSPIDRAWLGNKVGDGHITLTIPLPPQVEGLELSGSFDEDASRVADGKLITASPLFPGRSEFRLVYTVPARNGAVELPIATPAAAANLIVFVPADDVEVTATGLTGGQAVDMGAGGAEGGGKVRMYRAQNVAAGTIANLLIKGLKAVQPDEAAVVAPASKFSARNLAMGGAFLMVLGGAGLMLMKKPQNRTTKT